MVVSGPAWAADDAASSADGTAAVTASASATQTTEDDELDKNEIVITGARSILPATALPLTFDVLGGEALDDQIAVSGSVIDAVSARMPSFSPTREKLSGSGESLRGRSPLFAINGVPQSTPIRDGSRDGYTIDPFFVDRVEVIYGSNALQGIGATGGVVNQITVGAPSEDGWAGRTLVQATADDGFGGSTLGGKLAGLAALRSGAFDATAGVSFERRGVFLDGDGRRIGVDGTQGEIQDSDSWSLFGRFGYQLSDSARIDVTANRFQLQGNGQYVVIPGDRAAGLPTSSKRGDIEGEAPTNRAELLSVALTDRNLGGGNLVAQAFFSRTRDIFGGLVTTTFQDPAIDPSGQLFDQSANQSRKLGGKLSYERAVPGFDALTLTGGFDALFDRTEQYLVQTGRAWVPQTDFRSLAPFAQGNLKLLDGKLRLSGGARFENVQLKVGDFETLAFYGATDAGDVSTYKPVQVAGGKPSFHRVLWNGGVVVEPVRGLRAYASYAEGYTIADVGRILRGITDEGVDVDDFLSIEPVVSNNREIGLEWTRGPVKASASYFWSHSDLGSILKAGADGIFSVLRQPISIEGLDASVDWQTPIEGVALGAAYSHTEGRTDTNDDGSLESDLDGANIAPDRLNLYATLARGPFDARLNMRNYFEREFKGGDPRNDFGGYTLFDAFVGYRIGQMHRLTLGIQNLTDKQYVTYYSDTQAPTDNNRFFAGRGRTVTLGLTSDF
jgi:iron complex outermembrane receptor protein